MWQPTDPHIESDNKKLEELESAAADAPASYSSGDNNSATIQKQQQNFNNFNNISSKDQLQQQNDDCLDSGICSENFTSSSNIDSSEIKLNIPPTAAAAAATTTTQHHQQQQQQQQQQPEPEPEPQQQQHKPEKQIYLDSGCIVSEQIADEDDYNLEGEDVQFEEEAPEQVLHQTSNEAGAEDADQPMLLEHKVDANIEEWFCNLSLQTDQTAGEIAGGGPNNLNASDTNPQEIMHKNIQEQPQQQEQQQQQEQPMTDFDPSNAWERFFVQNDDGENHLHIACAFGEDDVVAALIRMAPHPCLFDIQNIAGQTALHIAAHEKQPKIIRMLLTAGAEPLKRDCHGNTALHLACYGGELQTVRALTMKISQSEINEAERLFGHRLTDNKESMFKCADLPADLEIRNYQGQRCTHIAAELGLLDIFRHLELVGADVNAREGHSGYTPLHLAIKQNHEDIITFLVKECSSLKIETPSYGGYTAYQIADELDRYQMTKILKEHGAIPLSYPSDSEYESSDSEEELDDSIDDGYEDEKEPEWFRDPEWYRDLEGIEELPLFTSLIFTVA